MAKIGIPEKEIGDGQNEQPVFLKAHAYPEQTFQGHVVRVAPVVQAGGGNESQSTVVVTTEHAKTPFERYYCRGASEMGRGAAGGAFPRRAWAHTDTIRLSPFDQVAHEETGTI